MSREQKIELLISLINQLPEEDRETTISLIACIAQTPERRASHLPKDGQ